MSATEGLSPVAAGAPAPTTVVFCGPTITPDQVRAVLPDAICLPPVAQGDVLQALAHRPRIIAIVDGYFDQVPAVWHKEILFALTAGVHVWGSSSMGALRAAELHTLGMVGVGDVFEAFASGRYTDDDEVAVFHGPPEEGYRAVSSAMVDLRDRFARAAADGVVPVDVAVALTGVAKALPYRDRTVNAVAHHAREGTVGPDGVLGSGPPVATEHLDAVKAFVKADGPGQKLRDAQALLAAVREFRATDPPPFQATFELPRTVFFDALFNEVDRLLAGRDERADYDPEVVLWTGETMPIVRKQQLLRVLARMEADRLGLGLTQDEVEQTAANFRVRYGLVDPDEIQAWLDGAGLTGEQFMLAMADMTAVEKMEKVYKLEVDAGVARLIRLAEARRRTRNEWVADADSEMVGDVGSQVGPPSSTPPS